MPTNRKTRKLQYIRTKNSLWKGAWLRDHIIAQRSDLEKDGWLESELARLVEHKSKLYKLPLMVHRVNANPSPTDPDLIAINFSIRASMAKLLEA